MLRENQEIIDDFINYKINYNHISHNTITAYNQWIGRFALWAEEHEFTLLTVPSEKIFQYKEELLKKGVRNATVELAIRSLSSFYKWCIHPTIQRLEKNPIPHMRLEAQTRLDCLIPSAKQIFMIRNRCNFVKLWQATAFEMVLSSGMRASEMCQLRFCDIHHNNGNVFDAQLKCISPFIGGWAMLEKRHGIKVKRGKDRKIYFSKLAIKLLNKLTEESGVDNNSRLPILGGKNYIDLNSVVRRAGTVLLKHVNQPSKRNANFTDVTEIDLNNATKMLERDKKKFLEKIERAKAKAAELEARYPGIGNATRVEPPKRIVLHTHCLRHSFCMLMYYRTWFGTVNDIQTVAQLMGHEKLDETLGYQKLEPVCDSVEEWKRVMMGNGMEYRIFLA